MTKTDQRRNRTFWQLRWQIRLTWAGMLAERLTRAFWPLASVLIGVCGVLALGLGRRLPPDWHLPLAVILGLVALVLLVRGLRDFRLPRRPEALARLDATLPGRPLAALRDVQAVGAQDPASARVWEAHLQRMAARAAAARAPAPDLSQTRADPYALRYLALVLGVMALGFGSLSRLGDVGPAAPATATGLAPGPSWEGWIRPPAYTGRPTIYLNDISAEALEIPFGSRVTLRFYGDPDAVTVTETVSDPQVAETLPQTATVIQGQEFIIAHHGRIEISAAQTRGWDIGVLPDLPPVVAVKSAPAREADGRMKLPFTAGDDYGVLTGLARITLDLDAVDRRHGLATPPEARDPVMLDLPLPYAGKRTEIAETLVDDLSKHPFANLPVRLELEVKDAAGQSGRSDVLATALPGKRFFDPLAASVAEARRDILWSIENRQRAALVLRAVTWLPEELSGNDRALARLHTAIRQMDRAVMTPPARDILADELWDIAMLLEEGDLNSALERLKRAQDRLDEAMKNGASPSEINELMQELREAMDEYMRQLAEQGERAPEDQPQGLEGMEMTGDQLQELLDKLQELMEQGRMDEAQELMEMLRQLMQNMQVQQGQGEGQGQGQGQGRMRDLGNTLREQQGLSDEAFRDMQEGFEREMRRQSEGQGQQGQQGQGGGNERSLADRQRDLRNRLRALGQTEMPGDGSEAAEEGRRALDQAGRAMEQAEEALREGNTPGALDRQSDAMEALRDGMRAFERAQSEERGPSAREGRPERDTEGESTNPRDPLGRSANQTGENMLGQDDPYSQALDLLRELRRRSAERERPEEERDYYRRLLDQF